MAYNQLPTRTTSDPNAASDVNQLQDNIDAILGSEAASGPSKTLPEKVTGPASATDSNFAQFDGTTGKLVKDGGYAPSSFGFPAGAMLPYVGTSAPTGWILANGDTIGDVGSGADHESADYEDLFDLLNVAGKWGNAGGAVWGNGDTVKLPDPQGLALSFAGANGTLTDANGSPFSRTLGTGENDQEQGHKHHVAHYATGTFSSLSSSNYLQHYYNPGNNDNYQLRGDTSVPDVGLTNTPQADGTNGTPRTGTETKMANLPFTAIIKY